jgi:hypothetical protein
LDVEAVDEQHRGAEQEGAQLKGADLLTVDDIRDVDRMRH